MGQPGFFPAPPVPVELRQTHISYVFLVGDWVYKVKKPVRFTFLDYSTLDLRKKYCEEEVRLNRRLAPSVYLGVLPILKHGEDFLLGKCNQPNEESAVMEYAVKMRRLPEDRMLDRLVRKGTIGATEMEAIARTLVSFHQGAAADHAATFGSRDSIWQRLSDNFSETEPYIGQTISRHRFTRIQEFSLKFLEQRRQLFESRIQEQRIRDGHGDLRAAHICLTKPLAVFDCIEFSQRLRYCDVASEMAFLAMDLDYLGAPELSEQLIAAYADLAKDAALIELMPFYKCYRAYVRGKVASLKSREEEVPESEREAAVAEACRYFRLAYRYTKDSPRPSLLIVCGLAGTGKSTVARLLSDLTGFKMLNSDVLRKRLAGVSTGQGTGQGYREGIYNHAFTELTYSALLTSAEESLRAGHGIIVDATFKDPQHRRQFLESAIRIGVPLLFAECRARKDEVIRRLQRRATEPNEVSDATVKVYLRQREEFIPFNAMEGSHYISIDTESELEKQLLTVENLLTRLASKY